MTSRIGWVTTPARCGGSPTRSAPNRSRSPTGACRNTPGAKARDGHRHKTQEEIYFVISGKLQFKLGDEVVEVGKHEAIRVPPQTWRGVWNDEPEDAELIIVSARIDDPSADGEFTDDDFWPL